MSHHPPTTLAQMLGASARRPAALWRGLARALRPVLLLLALLLCAASARALPALVLDDAVPSVQAWPAVTMLSDPSARLSVEQVYQRLNEFRQPEGPQANLGPRRDVVWLHLPLQVAAGDGRWVLDIDYASLNLIDVHVLQRGQPVAQAMLGNARPFDQRPMATRSHAMALSLAAGQAYELLIRVETSSAMVLPISLNKAVVFYAREQHEQLLQGVLLGLAGALLVYSLVTWLGWREPSFLHNGLMLFGLSFMFLTYFGIANQYLWNHQTGLLAKASPISVLLALVGGSQFVLRSLQVRRDQVMAWYGLQAVTVLGVAGLVLTSAGLLDYRSTLALATMLGPLPMLFAIPVGFAQARQGDALARNMLMGWSAYMVGTLTLVLLVRGLVAPNFWTQHMFQFSTVVEMLFWTRVLSLRVEAIRRGAERAELEKQALVSLAHTDALTGLPNRRGLSQALAQLLPSCGPSQVAAVYVLDLDGFKPVNDRWGHDAGDALLVQVAQRLRAQLRRGDVVARLGGDEFVIMTAGIGDEATAMALGHKILRAFDQDFEVLGQRCHVGITIGFALAPHDGRNADDLLKRADAAMYAGKQRGRHCVQRGGASLAMQGN